MRKRNVTNSPMLINLNEITIPISNVIYKLAYRYGITTDSNSIHRNPYFYEFIKAYLEQEVFKGKKEKYHPDKRDYLYYLYRLLGIIGFNLEQGYYIEDTEEGPIYGGIQETIVSEILDEAYETLLILTDTYGLAEYVSNKYSRWFISIEPGNILIVKYIGDHRIMVYEDLLKRGIITE